MFLIVIVSAVDSVTCNQLLLSNNFYVFSYKTWLRIHKTFKWAFRKLFTTNSCKTQIYRLHAGTVICKSKFKVSKHYLLFYRVQKASTINKSRLPHNHRDNITWRREAIS